MVRQVLIVTMKNGDKNYFASSNWSKLYDYRDKVEMQKGVVETTLEYDVGQFKGKKIKRV